MKPLALFFFCCCVLVGTVSAQDATPAPLPPATDAVQCGDVVEGEFVRRDDLPSSGRILWYTLDTDPGTKVTLVGNVPGETLGIGFAVYNPARQGIEYLNTYPDDSGRMPTLVTPALASRGTHWIAVTNVRSPLDYKINGAMNSGGEYFDTTFGTLGFFTMSISCELPSGETIAAGSSTSLEAPTTEVLIPLILDAPTTATIMPGVVDVMAFGLDAQSEGALVLSMTRLSGNVRSGVTVYSPSEEIDFQAIMMPNSPSLTVQIEPLVVGSYRIVVYSVDDAGQPDLQPAIIQVQARLK